MFWKRKMYRVVEEDNDGKEDEELKNPEQEKED